ncbi:hypothetical protein, conserved in T. vivax [Trypanosoma vivax Y486]|uniref:Transmembrane protein n=1 Tax=Trypanosoma vivax (strain Y486) TaxID=1055687 RepID=F9WLU2_TRYVY|nr:hypothetical protein, conserved in T. vivax [Trypanosoma vivax Y486]|eukprot:CCD18486.1 hypothetical protein, conserved in T. vivax [Trypanosoma vivax Y486]
MPSPVCPNSVVRLSLPAFFFAACASFTACLAWSFWETGLSGVLWRRRLGPSFCVFRACCFCPGPSLLTLVRSLPVPLPFCFSTLSSNEMRCPWSALFPVNALLLLMVPFLFPNFISLLSHVPKNHVSVLSSFFGRVPPLKPSLVCSQVRDHPYPVLFPNPSFLSSWPLPAAFLFVPFCLPRPGSSHRSPFHSPTPLLCRFNSHAHFSLHDPGPPFLAPVCNCLSMNALSPSKRLGVHTLPPVRHSAFTAFLTGASSRLLFFPLPFSSFLSPISFQTVLRCVPPVQALSLSCVCASSPILGSCSFQSSVPARFLRSVRLPRCVPASRVSPCSPLSVPWCPNP